jgi:hypothetical protein
MKQGAGCPIKRPLLEWGEETLSSGKKPRHPHQKTSVAFVRFHLARRFFISPVDKRQRVYQDE